MSTQTRAGHAIHGRSFTPATAAEVLVELKAPPARLFADSAPGTTPRPAGGPRDRAR